VNPSQWSGPHRRDSATAGPGPHVNLAADNGVDARLSTSPIEFVLGVDIGVRGALAIVTRSGDLVDVADMPILHDGPAGRPTVNAPLLAAIVARWSPSLAYIEFVGARPGEGAVGAFAFGRSKGVVEGVLGAWA
jgi:hypothetical protein